jgi:hypothetical protein
MAMTIALQDESGNSLQQVFDTANMITSELDKHRDNKTMVLMDGIDPYCDTTFNRVQMDRFVKELDILREGCTNAAVKTMLTAVRAMADKCRTSVDLYLKFIGD